MDFIIHGELVADHGPVRHRPPTPFLVQFSDPQIEQLQQRVLVGKGALFRDLSETGIDTFNGVGRVHDLADRAAIVEQLSHMDPVSYPYVNGARVSAPCRPKSLKLCLCSRETGRAVDLLQVSSKSFIFF